MSFSSTEEARDHIHLVADCPIRSNTSTASSNVEPPTSKKAPAEPSSFRCRGSTSPPLNRLTGFCRIRLADGHQIAVVIPPADRTGRSR